MYAQVLAEDRPNYRLALTYKFSQKEFVPAIKHATLLITFFRRYLNRVGHEFAPVLQKCVDLGSSALLEAGPNGVLSEAARNCSNQEQLVRSAQATFAAHMLTGTRPVAKEGRASAGHYGRGSDESNAALALAMQQLVATIRSAPQDSWGHRVRSGVDGRKKECVRLPCLESLVCVFVYKF